MRENACAYSTRKNPKCLVGDRKKKAQRKKVCFRARPARPEEGSQPEPDFKFFVRAGTVNGKNKTRKDMCLVRS